MHNLARISGNKVQTRVRVTLDQLIKKVTEGIFDAIGLRQVKSYFNNWFPDAYLPDFIPELLNEVVNEMPIDTFPMDDNKVNWLLQVLTREGQANGMILPDKIRQENHRLKRLVKIIAHQSLPVLIRTRLQYWHYVKDDRSVLLRLFRSPNELVEYIRNKKTEIKDLTRQALLALLNDISNYLLPIRRRADINLSDVDNLVHKQLIRLELDIEKSLLHTGRGRNLWEAARDNSTPEDCYALIAAGADLHYMSPDKEEGKGVLHIAAEKGHPQVIRSLLNIQLPGQELFVDATDLLKRTPFILAILHNHREPQTLKDLLEVLCKPREDWEDEEAKREGRIAARAAVNLAIVEKHKWQGYTPLLILAYLYSRRFDNLEPNPYLDMITLLLETGADLNAIAPRDNWSCWWGGATALHFAVTNGSIKLVKVLIAHKVFPFTRDQANKLAIERAIHLKIQNKLKNYMDSDDINALRHLSVRDLQAVDTALEELSTVQHTIEEKDPKTGKNKIKSVGRKIHITDPEHSDTKMPAYDISRMQLSASQMYALFRKLNKTGVGGLNFHQSNLDSYIFSAIRDFICDNYQIRVLDINESNFDRNAAEILAHGLRGNKSLMHLDISANQVADVGLKNIFHALMKHPRINNLRCLYNTGIQIEGALHLLELICTNGQITELDIVSIREGNENDVKLPSFFVNLFEYAISYNKNRTKLPEIPNGFIAQISVDVLSEVTFEQTLLRISNGALSRNREMERNKTLYAAVARGLGKSDIEVQVFHSEIAKRIRKGIVHYEKIFDAYNHEESVLLADVIEGIERGDRVATIIDVGLIMRMLKRPIILISRDGTISRQIANDVYKNDPIFIYQDGHEFEVLVLAESYRKKPKDVLKILEKNQGLARTLAEELCIQGCSSALEWILSYLPNNYADEKRLLILAIKSEACSVELLESVLGQVTDVNVVDADGKNALDLAIALNCSQAIIQMLIDHGIQNTGTNSSCLITKAPSSELTSSIGSRKVDQIKAWKELDKKLKSTFADLVEDNNRSFYQIFMDRYSTIYEVIYQNNRQFELPETLEEDKKKIEEQMNATIMESAQTKEKVEKLKLKLDKTKSSKKIEKYKDEISTMENQISTIEENAKKRMAFYKLILERIEDVVSIPWYVRTHGAIASRMQSQNTVSSLIGNSAINLHRPVNEGQNSQDSTHKIEPFGT